MKTALGCVLGVRNRPPAVLERTLQTYAYQTREAVDKVLIDYGSEAKLAETYRRLCQHFGWRVLAVQPEPPGWNPSDAYNRAVTSLDSEVEVVFKSDVDVLLGSNVLETAADLGRDALCIFSCLTTVEGAAYPSRLACHADLVQLLRSSLGLKQMDAEGLLAYPRKWFEDIGGFDLAFTGWGYEDSDLRERAKWSIGVKMVTTCLLIHQWHLVVRRAEDVVRNHAYYRKMVESRLLVRNGGALTSSPLTEQPVTPTCGLKLNLGCGTDFRVGWLNIDCRPLHPEGPEFLCCELLALDGRVADDAVDHILARGVLECIPWREVDALLSVLGKKLRPGGVLSLRLPDAEQIARAFVDGSLTPHEAQRLLYGEQAQPEEARKSLWCAAEVERRLRMVGLELERLERRGFVLLVRGRRAS